MIYPNGHVDYLMYENGGALIGIAKVTMPTIKYKTVTASDAGLIGVVVGAEVAGLGTEVSGDDVSGLLAGDTRQLNLHTKVLLLHHIVHLCDLPKFCRVQVK